MTGKLCVVVASLLALAGCSMPGVKPGAALPADEGILVTSLRCQSTINFVNVYASGSRSEGMFSLPPRTVRELGCSGLVVATPLKAGRYYLGGFIEHGYGRNVSMREAESLSFTITPNATTYIGEILLTDTWAGANPVGMRVLARDRSVETLQLLQARQPWVVSNHPWHVALGSPAPGMLSPQALEDELKACGQACFNQWTPPPKMLCPTADACTPAAE